MTPLVPNPLNRLARIGVGLLAIYWAVGGLMQVTDAVASGMRVASALGSDDFLATIVETVGLVGGAALLFSVVPAVWLFRYRDVIGERLVSVNEPGPTLAISGADALRVGCLLLALWLGIRAAGAAIVATSLTALGLWTGSLSSTGLAESAIHSGSRALVEFTASALLWRFATRASYPSAAGGTS